MPLANMALLFGGIAFLLILAAIIIKKLHINSLGPIKMEHRNQSVEHKMNEETREADDLCLKKIRQMTNNMKVNFSNIFSDLNVCTLAKVAIASAIRYPLYESITNNHFTTELMPENFKEYRERIIGMIKEEYVALLTEIHCKKETLPAWEIMSKPLIERVDLWIKNVSREIILTCRKKKAIYNNYLPIFKDMKDDWRVDIVTKCIEKNEWYDVVLKERIGMA